MQRVFISYSRRDKNFAERLARDLSDAGLDIWIDFRQIYAGELWQEEIKRGIERSEMLIVCLSPDSVKSKWVQFEVNLARTLGKLIIPVMAVEAMDALKEPGAPLGWLLDIHFIRFENRYEEAFPELLLALPGKRAIGVYDDIDPADIPNPFKGLEAFQQTDAKLFFGREDLIRKTLQAIQSDQDARFVAVVGASGSGKSSLVRAGVIPQVRAGNLPDSETWRIIIFTPGSDPIDALATRLSPLLEGREADEIAAMLHEAPENLHRLTEEVLPRNLPTARLLLVVDQFEEAFTRAGDHERGIFLDLLTEAATLEQGRTSVLITMRADFFDQLGRYPRVAELFEQDNLVIVTEMTASNLMRAIRGPAETVGLVYEDGLVDRILDDVRRQPGSLPLLQYALKALYERRDGRRLTNAAYEVVGGVQRALAQRAEEIYRSLNSAQQDIMRRILLRLIEVNENGEVTRRRVQRDELYFQSVNPQAVKDVIDLMTAAESRLLVASREIKTSGSSMEDAPVTWLEVSHEALIREWERLKGWISDDIEQLRLGSEILKAAQDWRVAGQDSAYLLTGNRLIRAEEWVQHADANNLQRDFIRVSLEERANREAIRQEQAERELMLQRQSAARLRGFVIVLIVGLVVAVGLTLLALQQRADADLQRALAEERSIFADQQRLIAERAAAEASSFALASGAERALADSDNELAVALAVEANLIDNPPPQSRLTLSNVSYAPGTRRVMEGHTLAVNNVIYSPDGTHAFSASSDRTVIMWNLATGEIVKQFEGGFDRAVTSLDLTPDGTQLLTGSDNGMLLWDIVTGQEIRRFPTNGAMNAIIITPDGDFVLAAINRDLTYWNLETGELLKTFSGHTETVTDIALSPVNSSIAASSGRDGQLFLWNLDATNDLTLDTESTDETIFSIAFNPAGDSLITGSDSGRVRLWGLGLPIVGATHEAGVPALQIDNKRIRDFEGHAETAQVRAVVFSPDGNFIASGAADQSIIIWTLDGRPVLTLNGHTEAINSLVFNANGERLLSAGPDRTVRLWDVRRSEIVQDFIGHNGEVSAAVFMPDGKTVVSGSFDGMLRLWDIQTGRTLQEYEGHTGRVRALAVSKDGRTLVSSGDDRTVIIWDIAAGVPREIGGELQVHENIVSDIEFLPGDTQFVTSSHDGTLIRWDVQTGTMIGEPFTLAENSGDEPEPLNAVAVSPDGTLFASAGGNNPIVSGIGASQVVLWTAANGGVRRFEQQEQPITAIAFSADGQRIVSGTSGGNITVWDLSGNVEEQFEGHDRAISSIVFTADGTSLLTSSEDGTIRQWDIASGFETRRYLYEQEQVKVLSLTLSANGQSILTGLSNNTLRLWRVLPNVDALLTWAFNNRYVPLLTCDQRVQFRLSPCDENGTPPEREIPDLQPVSPEPETVVQIQPNTAAVVNITGIGAQRLHIRFVPGINASIISTVSDGELVTVLEGPEQANGMDWWRVSKANGFNGWVAAFLVAPPENLQTIVPLSIFEQN